MMRILRIASGTRSCRLEPPSAAEVVEPIRPRMSSDTSHALRLDGRSLTLADIRRFDAERIEVQLASEARDAMLRSAETVRDAVHSGRVSYGITTGFGAFANQR